MTHPPPRIESGYHVTRRRGPEAHLEDIVLAALRVLLPSNEQPSCIFRSRTIGAGAPDLTIVYNAPGVSMPADSHPAVTGILAYLRVVNQAKADTLRQRLRLQERVFATCIDALTTAGAIRADGD